MPTTSPRQRTADHAAPLWRNYVQSRSIADRNALVTWYFPIVPPIANRMRLRLINEVSVDDLISAGSFGLLDAVRKFDPDRGAKFSTFSLPRIRGAMLDELRKADWVPRLVRQNVKSLDRAVAALTERYGRAPTDRELARYLKMKIAAFREMRRKSAIVQTTSMDKPWFVGSKTVVGWIDNADTGHDCIAQRCTVHQPSSNEATEDFWRYMTRGLCQQERLAFLLYYRAGETMRNVGAALDLSESRVSQVLSQVRGRLKKCRARSECNDMLQQIG